MTYSDKYSSSEKILLYKITVKGRVQGVGFRWNAAKEAMSRGITGYVRNLNDGSVYIEAEGYREHLDDYIKWCRKGPAYAFVESVEAESFPPSGYSDFRIG